jgi:pentatricopeptide repeat protein
LLLRFKEVGHAQALDLFYHDVVLCGFMPNAMSYCVRMDAYYKKGRFLYALQMLDEIRSSNDDGRGDYVQQHRRGAQGGIRGGESTRRGGSPVGQSIGLNLASCSCTSSSGASGIAGSMS